MTPFINQKYGPSWFTKDFPTSNTDQDTEFLDIWGTFLTPRLLVDHVDDPKAHIKILRYQPNLVARQFGLGQLLPKSLYSRKSDLCLCIIPYIERSYIELCLDNLLMSQSFRSFHFTILTIAP